MPEKLYRAQLLLEPEQHRALAQIAEREGRSISDVARQVIAAGLDVIQKQEDIWAQRERALEGLRQIRETQDIYHGNLIDEVRDERDQENEDLWKGQ